MELTTSHVPAVLPPFRAATLTTGRAADRPAVDTDRPAPTGRRSWLTLYGLIAAVTVARAPAAYRQITDEVPADVSAGIGDAQMQALALQVGTVLAVVVYLFAIGLYLSLAAVLEQRVFGAGVAVGRRHTVGLFFLVAALCILPVQVHGLLTDGVGTPDGPLAALYFLLVVVLAPLVFHATLRTLRPSRVALLYVVVGLMVALVGLS